MEEHSKNGNLHERVSESVSVVLGLGTEDRVVETNVVSVKDGRIFDGG